MRQFWKVMVMGVTMMLSGCSDAIDHYNDTLPKIDIKEYFSGPIKCWGLVQDWRGRVVARFDIDMEGKWQGDIGTLTEHFVYYDGRTQDRMWTITKVEDDKYVGTAPDVLDKAYGRVNGTAVQWSYTMDLPVADTTYRIKFDDWMWQMNDGVLINRSYLKKFGITVSELTIFMQKQKQ